MLDKALYVDKYVRLLATNKWQKYSGHQCCNRNYELSHLTGTCTVICDNDYVCCVCKVEFNLERHGLMVEAEKDEEEAECARKCERHCGQHLCSNLLWKDMLYGLPQIQGTKLVCSVHAKWTGRRISKLAFKRPKYWCTYRNGKRWKHKMGVTCCFIRIKSV